MNELALKAAGALVMYFVKNGDVNGVFSPKEMAQVIEDATNINDLASILEEMTGRYEHLEALWFSIAEHQHPGDHNPGFNGTIARARKFIAEVKSEY